MDTASGASVAFDHLLKAGAIKPTPMERPSPERLRRTVAERLDASLTPTIQFPVLSLTARHPYDAKQGRVDMYRPGRWDTEIDLVFMDHVVKGPSAGQWDGSVGYVHFAPPSSGKYLILVYFNGYQTTMTVNGPWGAVSDYTATTSDQGYAVALWTAVGGAHLYFSFACSNAANLPSVGYMDTIQVFHA